MKQDNSGEAPITDAAAKPVNPTENVKKGQGRKYSGPDYPTGTKLHAYGRTIDPKSWTDDEYTQWTTIEPRYSEYFE